MIANEEGKKAKIKFRSGKKSKKLYKLIQIFGDLRA
jgi:hypothetical protein